MSVLIKKNEFNTGLLFFFYFLILFVCFLAMKEYIWYYKRFYCKFYVTEDDVHR